MASSLSMMRRGSPNSDGVFTSVARISPLRSTMSGRAVAIASCEAAARRGRRRYDKHGWLPMIAYTAMKAAMAKPTRAL